MSVTKLFLYPLSQVGWFVLDLPKPLAQLQPVFVHTSSTHFGKKFRGHAKFWQARQVRRAWDDFHFSMLGFDRVHVLG